MRALVTGGAASGKSAYAEELALKGPETRYYLATMSSRGAEARSRIRRHLALREGKGFETLELENGLGKALNIIRACPGTVLVEDLGNLIMSFLYTPAGRVRTEDEVCADVLGALQALSRESPYLVAVSSEVGADGICYGGETATYMRVAGRTACAFASASDLVVEVASGMPCVLRGEL